MCTRGALAAVFVEVGWEGDVVCVLLTGDFDRLFASGAREDLPFVAKRFTKGINTLSGEGFKVVIDVVFGGTKGFAGAKA